MPPIRSAMLAWLLGLGAVRGAARAGPAVPGATLRHARRLLAAALQPRPVTTP